MATRAASRGHRLSLAFRSPLPSSVLLSAVGIPGGSRFLCLDAESISPDEEGVPVVGIQMARYVLDKGGFTAE